MGVTNLGRVQGGSVFYSSATSGTSIAKATLTPTAITPLVGDNILFSNGDLRLITSVASTSVNCGTPITNITGPKGDRGDRGESTTKIWITYGEPTYGEEEKVGDIHINTATWGVSLRNEYEWEYIDSIRGEKGNSIHVRDFNPVTSLIGVVGDLLLNSLTGDIYQRTAYAQWTFVCNIKGPKGDGEGNIDTSQVVTRVEFETTKDDINLSLSKKINFTVDNTSNVEIPGIDEKLEAISEKMNLLKLNEKKMYNTAAIGTDEQDVETLWNKILTIKKYRNEYDDEKRIYLKLVITSVIDSLKYGLEPKQTVLEISHIWRDLPGYWNTFINATDFTETKLKVFEDEDHIYVYAQNYALGYGDFLNINVTEEIGEIERIIYHYEAGFEKLPTVSEDITEFPIELLPGYKYDYTEGILDWDWEKWFKLFTIKVRNYEYKRVDFLLTCQSGTLDFYQKAEMLFYKNLSNSAFKVSANNLYVVDKSTSTEFICEVYSQAFVEGVSPRIQFNYLEEVYSEDIEININNIYEDIDAEQENVVTVEGNSVLDQLKTRGISPLEDGQHDVGTPNISYRDGYFNGDIISYYGVVKTGHGATMPDYLTESLAGSMYFNTELSKPVWWNGSTWVHASGEVTTIKQEEWITPTLINGWSSEEESGSNAVGYRKDATGIVHLRGKVVGGSDNVIFKLPIEYTPKKYLYCPVATGTGNVVGNLLIDNGWINEEGDVRIYSLTEEIYLDGVSFYIGL